MGKFEVIRPGDKIEEEVDFGDKSKCLPPGPTDAPTPPLPTSKPTDVPTSSPSLVPTTSPTATDKVLTEIMIQFDNFPEDITWKLFRDCNNVRELLGEDGPYDNPGDVDKLVTVFNETLEEGLFLFNIFDSYGDGLCCEQGNGYFAIVYGSTIIYNEFRVTSGERDANEERVEFGQETENCLAPTSEPTSSPTFSPTSYPGFARFNATLGVPLCAEEAVKCETLAYFGVDRDGLLEWKNAANEGDTPELNGPNTLDGCADGNSGLYANDESVDAILVESLNTPMSNLRAGGPVRITASVHAYNNADRVDFYLSNNPEAGENTIWTLIGTTVTFPESFPGLTSAQIDTNLLDAPLQAVRVIIRWSSGTNQANPLQCPTDFPNWVPPLDNPDASAPGTFSDTDDLAFKVDTTSKISLSQLFPVNSIQSLEMPPATVTDCPTLSDERCKATDQCPDCCGSTCS